MTAITEPTTYGGAAIDNARELTVDATKERGSMFSLCSPSLLLVIGLLFLPVGWLMWLSFFDVQGNLTSENYMRMVESKTYIKTFKTTFEVSIYTTSICILIGYPLAYFLSQLPARAANIGMIFVILPCPCPGTNCPICCAAISSLSTLVW